jgi:1,2-diacylglycerol 3-alpha-glucosyltransferase
MRILIAGANYVALHGQAMFTVNLAEGLAARGHTVTVVFASEERRPYSRMRNGVHLEALRSIDLTFMQPFVYVPVFSRRRLGGILDAARPDIVHIQDHYPLSHAIVQEARRRDIKVIGSNHFMPENLAPYVPVLSGVKPVFNWLLWKWMRYTYDRLEVVGAQSQAGTEILKARGLRPPVVRISCGIDLGRFHPSPATDRDACRQRYGLSPDNTIFLFVGRVDGEKRVDVLLRAMALLQRNDVQLVIAGHGSASRGYQALAHSLNLGSRVRFTGFVPNEDLPGLLNSVDVFTMPSEAELLSIASLEAMASGLPLLLADAVALPELVTPGENGYLFSAGDAADAAHYMNLLASDAALRQAMGHRGIERARQHSLERTIEHYATLYVQVLESAPVLQPEPYPMRSNRGSEMAHRGGPL